MPQPYPKSTASGSTIANVSKSVRLVAGLKDSESDDASDDNHASVSSGRTQSFMRQPSSHSISESTTNDKSGQRPYVRTVSKATPLELTQDDAASKNTSPATSLFGNQSLGSADIKRRIDELRERRLARASRSSSETPKQRSKATTLSNPQSHPYVKSKSSVFVNISSSDEDDGKTNRDQSSISEQPKQSSDANRWIKSKTLPSTDISMSASKPTTDTQSHTSSLQKQDSNLRQLSNKVVVVDAPTKPMTETLPLQTEANLETSDCIDKMQNHESISGHIGILKASSALETSDMELSSIIQEAHKLESHKDNPHDNKQVYASVSSQESIYDVQDFESGLSDEQISKAVIDVPVTSKQTFSNLDTMSDISSIQNPSIKDETLYKHTSPALLDHFKPSEAPITLFTEPTKSAHIEYESDSFEDADISLQLDTTEDDKEKFFLALKQGSGDQSLDYGALLAQSAIDSSDTNDNSLEANGLTHISEMPKNILEPEKNSSICTVNVSNPIIQSPSVLVEGGEKETTANTLLNPQSVDTQICQDFTHKNSTSSPKDSLAIETKIMSSTVETTNANPVESADTQSPHLSDFDGVKGHSLTEKQPENSNLVETQMDIEFKTSIESNNSIDADTEFKTMTTKSVLEPQKAILESDTNLHVSAFNGVSPTFTEQEVFSTTTALIKAMDDQIANHSRLIQSSSPTDSILAQTEPVIIQTGCINSTPMAGSPDLSPPIALQSKFNFPGKGNDQSYLAFADFLAMNDENDDKHTTFQLNPDSVMAETKPDLDATAKRSATKSREVLKPKFENTSTMTSKSTSKKKSTLASSKIPTLKYDANTSIAKHETNTKKPRPKTALSANGKTHNTNVLGSDGELFQAKKQALNRANARFAGKATNVVSNGLKSRPQSSPARIATKPKNAHADSKQLQSSNHVHSPTKLELNDFANPPSIQKDAAISMSKSDTQKVLFKDSSAQNDHKDDVSFFTRVPTSTPAEPSASTSLNSNAIISNLQASEQPIQQSSRPATDFDLETMRAMKDHIKSLESESIQTENEMNTLREQVEFLERKLSEVQLKNTQTLINDTENPSASVVMMLKAGPNISRKDAETLRKELNEQETLIRGYQNENEKLTTQVKTLRKELKESDQRHYLKQEMLLRENAMLKTMVGGASAGNITSNDDTVESSQGVNSDRNTIGSTVQGNLLPQAGNASYDPSITRSKTATNRPHQSDFSSVKAQVRIESLEQSLATLRHTSRAIESDLQARIIHLEAQLADANLKLVALESSDPEKLKRLESDFKLRCETYETYIVELEGKLEMYMENMDIVDESRQKSDMQQHVILDLKKEIERLEQVISFLTSQSQRKSDNGTGVKTPRGASKVAPDTVKQIQAGTVRIRELEQQVEKLRREKLELEVDRHTKTIADVTRTPKPPLEETDHVRLLRQRVKKLQTEYEAVVGENNSKTRIMQDEIKRLQMQYEAKIQKLEVIIQDLQASPPGNKIASSTQLKVGTVPQHTQALEKQPEAATLGTTSDLAESLTLQGQELSSIDSLIGNQREIALSKRILDLQSLVDEQSKRIDQLCRERQRFESETTALIQGKDELIESYRIKIVEQQKEFHHKVFAVDDHARMDEIHAMRLELESTRSELASVRNKLEISEETRRSVQESTISIMRQAQEENAKISRENHEQGIMWLRQEFQKKWNDSNKHEDVTNLHSKIKMLEAELATLRQTASNTVTGNSDKAVAYQAQIKALEEEVDHFKTLSSTLQSENQRLVSSLSAAKKKWPPAMHHFEALSSRIRELEESARRRETEIAKLLVQHRGDLESKIQMEHRRYQDMVHHKDSEIQGFRKELDKVLQGIKLLRKQNALNQ
ncbi:hypothetical protein QVD99_000281 [Batrachochytrium dendrobatidis]|nr:hypothetical protein QVD99_000281 [Batrachochytrium dendrobatidis]